MLKYLLLTCLLLSSQAKAGLLFESIEVGPSFRALYLPQPMSLGIEVKMLNGLIGLSAHKGFLPSSTIEGADVKLDNTDMGIKYHPFMSSFYVGVLMGNQTVKVSKSDVVLGQTVNYSAEVSGMYMTPHLGWMWTMPTGLFIGMQFGWQMNSEVKTTVHTSQDNNPVITNSQEYKETKQDVINTGNDLGSKSLPNIGLLQIGWLF